MKIDWKHLATTKGYKSLKTAYVRDIKKSGRRKDELIRHFHWVIGRATHYAYHTGKTVEHILNEWESKRDYWWLNYYEDSRQPKFTSGKVKPLGINGLRKYYKKCYRDNSIRVKKRICEEINRMNIKASKKTKPRWSARRKIRGY